MKFLVVTSVLLIVAIQSVQANPLSISSDLSEVTQANKIATDPNFQKLQDVIIKIGEDKDSLFAKAALEDIANIGSQFKLSGSLQLGLEKAIEGVLKAVRLVAAFGRKANTAIDKASNQLKANDKDGAFQTIKSELGADRDLIFVAGVPINNAQGNALALSGGAGIEGLTKSIIAIQKAGSAILEVDELADEIATLGISAGGNAAEEAFRAARKTISAGLATLYVDLKKAAQYAVENMVSAASDKSSQSNNKVSRILDSLKTQVSTDDSEALKAIAKLDKGLASVLKDLTNKVSIDAAKIIHQGLLSSILKSSHAFSLAKKSISESAKLAEKNPESAVDAVRKGIKAAEDEIFSASAPAFLALGAASELLGESGAEKLVPSVVEIEYGRVSAFEELALAERAAIVGIRSIVGEAVEPAIEAAQEIIDAAGAILYQDYADAGDIGFDVLRKL